MLFYYHSAENTLFITADSQELSSYYTSCHLGILVQSGLEILASSLLSSHFPLFLLLAVYLQTENYFCPFVLDASGH